MEIRKLQREQVVQQHEAEDMEASNQRMYLDSVIARRTGAPAIQHALKSQQQAATQVTHWTPHQRLHPTLRNRVGRAAPTMRQTVSQPASWLARPLQARIRPALSALACSPHPRALHHPTAPTSHPPHSQASPSPKSQTPNPKPKP